MTSKGHGRDIVATMKWKTHKGNYAYEITELDRDMLVRASAHEGPPHAEVVRVLLQRFAWVYPKYYTRMEDLVQAYVQPINPKWFPHGDRLLDETSRLRRRGQEAKALDQERRAVLRVGYANQPIHEVEGRFHTFVNRVLEDTADWSNVKGAIHYRAGRGFDNAEGESLALDFADDRGDGWFSIDAGHGFKAGTTWFFGIGKSKSLELTTELISEPEEKDDTPRTRTHELIKGIGEQLSLVPSDHLVTLAADIAKILSERGNHDGC